MTRIEWKDEYATGLRDVDFEHQRLIAMVNDVIADLENAHTDEDLHARLGDIHARIASHFALEEVRMQDMNYPEFDDHKADHERLLDEIRDIMDEVWNSPLSEIEADLALRLDHWFSRHFQTFDARLHRVAG